MFKQLLKMPLIRPVGKFVKASEQLSCRCDSLFSSGRQADNQVLMKRYFSSPVRKKLLAKGPVSWGSLAVFMLTGGACYAYVRHLKDEMEKERQKEQRKSVGMAALGGPFDLVDTEGNEVTDKDFLGKWVLIYFGFCHCPDICPDQLEKMTEVINQVNDTEGIPNLLPVYITVDPRRDTKEIIKEYIKDFHPDMIGLTGTEEQVKRVCKAYRVYFSAGPRDDDDDYIVDHTVIMYMLSPDGKFSEYFGQNKTISEIVSSISTRMIMKSTKS